MTAAAELSMLPPMKADDYTPENLREILDRAGVSQSWLAHRLGVQKSLVSRWLAPEHNQHRREMPQAAWELTLLLMDEHDTHRLVTRGTPEEAAALGRTGRQRK